MAITILVQVHAIFCLIQSLCQDPVMMDAATNPAHINGCVMVIQEAHVPCKDFSRTERCRHI